VYCEKPLAITETGMEHVIDAMKENPSALLTVGFNRRFAPMAQKMKGFFNEQDPLHIHYRVNAGQLPEQHWLHDLAQGGGRIIGEGCHFIDFLCFMAQDIPNSVQVTALPGNERHQNDNVTIVFSFDNGSVGVVEYLSNGPKTYPKEFVEVFQNGKAARLDDFRTLTLASAAGRKTTRSRLRQNKGHQAAWKQFVEAIQTGIPMIPYRHLIGVTQAAFSAVAALRTGEKVTIPDRWPD